MPTASSLSFPGPNFGAIDSSTRLDATKNVANLTEKKKINRATMIMRLNYIQITQVYPILSAHKITKIKKRRAKEANYPSILTKMERRDEGGGAQGEGMGAGLANTNRL